MPRYPSLPGICISSATSRTTIFSGVTISSWKVSAILSLVIRRGSFATSPSAGFGRRPRTNDQRPLLRYRLQLLCRFQYFVDLPLHVKRLFWNFVVLAFVDFLEAFYRIGDFYVAAGRAGKLFGYVERLREESLNLAGSRHRYFLIFTQFVNAQNRNDVLQVFVALQRFLHRLRHVIMFLANDARIENARGRSQRIDGGINSYLGQRPRKHCGRVQVGEGRGWSRISQVVRGNVNRLHRCDRSLL